MRQIGLLFFVLVVIITGCNDEEHGIELSIAETGCMNAWDDYYSDNNDYRSAVENYLKDNGIHVYQVYSKRVSDGPFCMACFCPTGRLIIIRIAEEDQTKAEALSFTLYEEIEVLNQ